MMWNHYSPKWRAETPKVGVDRNPVPIATIGGVIYKGAKDGWVIAVNQSDGKLLWEHKFSDADVNNVTSDEQGNVWVMCLDGKLFKIAR